MRNSVVTTLVVAGLSASLVGAQERTDSGAVGERFAYSIQYVAKDKVFKATLFKRKAESYDMISRYIQERISRVIDGRGFHVGGPKQSSVFAVTIDLLKVADNRGPGSLLNPLNEAATVTVDAAISAADSRGSLVFRKEYQGKASLPIGIERVVTMAGRAVDDLVIKLDNDPQFKEVTKLPSSGVTSTAAPLSAGSTSIPAANDLAGTQTSSRRVQLPAGTPLILAFEQDLSSSKSTEGDPVQFTLAEDLHVGPDTVAKAGTGARGSFYFEPLSKRQKFLTSGINGGASNLTGPGIARIRMAYIEVGEARITLRSEPDKKKESIIPGAELLSPIKEKRKNVFEVPRGTRVRAFTAEAVNLPVLP